MPFRTTCAPGCPTDTGSGKEGPVISSNGKFARSTVVPVVPMPHDDYHASSISTVVRNPGKGIFKSIK